MSKHKTKIKNFGFVSKKRLAREIRKYYDLYEPQKGDSKDKAIKCWDIQSPLVAIADKFSLDIRSEQRSNKE
jgi:hypothetical protein